MCVKPHSGDSWVIGEEGAMCATGWTTGPCGVLTWLTGATCHGKHSRRKSGLSWCSLEKEVGRPWWGFWVLRKLHRLTEKDLDSGLTFMGPLTARYADAASRALPAQCLLQLSLLFMCNQGKGSILWTY